MDNVAILIPCYNEAETIGKVISDWGEEIPDATIYVYDNNSTDETVKIANDLIKKYNVVVKHEIMQGKGFVVRRMFREVVARIPTLIVSGFMVIAALISFFSGLILQTIIRMEKRRFESQLQRIESDYKSSSN